MARKIKTFEEKEAEKKAKEDAEAKKKAKDDKLDKDLDSYIKPFLKDYKPVFSRYRSYDFVHKLFVDTIHSLANAMESRETFEPDWDYLALNLYMFLSSWGMLRNSFLLINNYKCLIDVCKLVCGVKYEYRIIEEVEDEKVIKVIENEPKDYTWLLDVNPTDEGLKEKGKERKDYVDAVCDLINSMRREIFASYDIRWLKKRNNENDDEEYIEFDANLALDGSNIENSWHNEEYYKEPNVSDTLVSKILLVTLGCVPAYDNYAKASLRDLGYQGSIGKITSDSGDSGGRGLYDLLDFVKYHESSLNKAIIDNETCRKENCSDDETISYSMMKYVDMILWIYGAKNKLYPKKKN